MKKRLKAGDRIFSFNSGLHVVRKVDRKNRMYICDLGICVSFDDCQLSATAEQIKEENS